MLAVLMLGLVRLGLELRPGVEISLQDGVVIDELLEVQKKLAGILGQPGLGRELAVKMIKDLLKE